MTIDTEGRHPSTQQIARWFAHDHLPSGSLQRQASADCESLADDMIAGLPDSPELTAGLRHLLEAKDCFVRAAIAASQTPETAS